MASSQASNPSTNASASSPPSAATSTSVPIVWNFDLVELLVDHVTTFVQNQDPPALPVGESATSNRSWNVVCQSMKDDEQHGDKLASITASKARDKFANLPAIFKKELSKRVFAARLALDKLVPEWLKSGEWHDEKVWKCSDVPFILCFFQFC
jgi:hypothetical protein